MMKPTERPAEWTTIASGAVAFLVLLGLDEDTATDAVDFVVLGVAVVPAVVTAIVARFRRE